MPPDEAALAGRRDFRDLPIVTIDGETARDFDDAVYAERKPGGWQLQVHIADVAHYVRRGRCAGSRSTAARHIRLFSGPRGADAAGSALKRYLFAEARTWIAW